MYIGDSHPSSIGGAAKFHPGLKEILCPLASKFYKHCPTSSAALKARTCLRCFERAPQSTANTSVL